MLIQRMSIDDAYEGNKNYCPRKVDSVIARSGNVVFFEKNGKCDRSCRKVIFERYLTETETNSLYRLLQNRFNSIVINTNTVCVSKFDFALSVENMDC